MNDKTIELVRGSGNVFRDFGYPDADVRQAKALLGARIMRVLDDEELSTRQAEERTAISHSDFSRIRHAKFSRFTIDRLMGILGLLGQEVEMSVTVQPRVIPAAKAHAPRARRPRDDDRSPRPVQPRCFGAKNPMRRENASSLPGLRRVRLDLPRIPAAKPHAP